MDVRLSPILLRRIIGLEVNMKHLEQVDKVLAKSLAWIVDNDITGIIYETFTATAEVFGVQESIPLVEGGEVRKLIWFHYVDIYMRTKVFE